MLNHDMRRFFLETMFFAGIFVAMFLFFTVAHPLALYDGDDWLDLSMMRRAIPLPRGYNPVKVLPEDLFPLVGTIAANMVLPLIGDYIYAVAVTSAAVFGLLICIYMYLFYRFIEHCFSMSYPRSMLFTILFLSLHFSLFYSHKSNPIPYLFGSIDLNCIYHYVIPAIVNLCLVLYFAHYDFKNLGISEQLTDTDDEKRLFNLNIASSGLLVFVIYLAIFSNILLSIILSAYISAVLLLRFFHKRQNRTNYRQFIKDNWVYFAILSMWLISIFLEANGGRSHDIGHSMLSLPVMDTAKIFIATITKISKDFWAAGLLLVASSLCISLKKKSAEYSSILKLYLLTTLIVLSYLLLVCSKANPEYIGRSDVFIAIIIWMVLLFCISLAYLVKILPRIGVILPIVVLYFIVVACIGEGIYQDSVISNGISAKECITVDRDIIQQVQLADCNGEKTVVVHVPKGDDHDNWPHPIYMGPRLAHTLYKHGMTSKMMDITIQPDVSMNEKYHIRK